MISPNKASGRPRLLYNDAVEEALCFGWIDSIIKKYDEGSSAQRYSPRNPKSGYSQQNKERIKWLLENDLVHPNIIDSIKHIPEEEFDFPNDVITEIMKDELAWKNYQDFSPSYQRIRIAYIEVARPRPEEFNKRMQNFIKKTRENKQIGYGGIEKYF